MTSKPDSRWQRTSPLAALFFLGRIVELVAKNAFQALAPMAAFLLAFEASMVVKATVSVVVIVVIPLIVSVTKYLFFRYRITEESILIREGVFKKRQLDIRFERIQAINSQQNPVFRYFDLVTLSFDTAGSSQQEGNLPAIESEIAESLKGRIRQQTPIEEDVVDDAVVDPPLEILRLQNADMVRIGLSSNRAFIFLALLGPLYEQIEQAVGRYLRRTGLDEFFEAAEISMLQGIGLGFAIVLSVALLLVLASIIGAFFRYHRFRLAADDDVLRSTGGLLTRHEHSINRVKIQTVRAVQNPMHRLFGRFRIRLRQASSGKPQDSKDFIVPVADPGQLDHTAAEVFREEFPEAGLSPHNSEFKSINARYIRSRVFLVAILPVLLLIGPASMLLGAWSMVITTWIPLCTLGAWLLYRRYGYKFHPDGVVLRSGFVGFRTSAFLHRKVQRISITQSLSQERRGLATIRFYLASGSLRLPYVDFEEASQLRDYILYRVESSQLAWH